MFPNVTLMDGVAASDLYPSTFSIPSDEEKSAVKPGDFVKIGFLHPRHPGERMWVKVTEPGKGTLGNTPVVFIGLLKYGEEILYEPKHILDILTPEDFK
jgi:hypothetical protein